jgi:hypothetical protein
MVRIAATLLTDSVERHDSASVEFDASSFRAWVDAIHAGDHVSCLAIAWCSVSMPVSGVRMS